MITLEGYITNFAVTAANIYRLGALWGLVSKYHSLTIFGAKGYINKNFATALKLKKNIDLIPIKRNNSKGKYPKPLRRLSLSLGKWLKP